MVTNEADQGSFIFGTSAFLMLHLVEEGKL